MRIHFTTSIGWELNREIKTIKKNYKNVDEQRREFRRYMLRYYAGAGRKKGSKELIRRLTEIKENRENKNFWLSIIIGAVFGLIVSAVFALVGIVDVENKYGLVILIFAICTIIAVTGWILRFHLDKYDALHLQEQEKKLIEQILKERLDRAITGQTKEKFNLVVTVTKKQDS